MPTGSRTTRAARMLTVVAAALGAAAPVAADSPLWRPIGPYGHDGYRLATTSDPQVVYATTHYSGLYRSDDQADRWREVSRYEFRALVVDPRDPDRFLGQARTGSGWYDTDVVRSDDGGRTFRSNAEGLLYEDAGPDVMSFALDPDDPDVALAATEFGLFRSVHEGPWELIGFPGFVVRAFAIDPRRPGTWYAAVIDQTAYAEGQIGGDVRVTHDRGGTWLPTAGAPHAEALMFDPARPHRLYALADCRPHAFAGGRWRRLDAPGGGCTMTVSAAGTLFVGARGGVRRSDDGGVTWNAMSGPADIILRIATPVAEPEVVIASGGRGLWRSIDGGMSWEAASEGIAGFVVGDLVLAGDAGGTLYASPGGEGVFRSRDQGLSWRRVVKGLGADARGAPLLAVDPRRPEVVWAGGTKLYRSIDGGDRWQEVPLGRGDEREIFGLVVDPRRAGSVYVLRYVRLGESLLGPVAYRTRDDGRTWHPLPRLHRDVIALAASPADGRLYAHTGRGFFMSRDGGSTWRRVHDPIERQVTALAVDPLRPGIVWLGSEEDGLSRSDDNGRTFRHLAGSEYLFAYPTSFVFDPADPDHPYVGIAAGGVVRWTGSGNGWQRVGAADLRFEETFNGPLVLDPARRLLFAGTSTHGLYRLRLR